MSRGVQGDDNEAIKVTWSIVSLSVFQQISVIAVFPLKTGNSMFVGFDSQNTFHSVLPFVLGFLCIQFFPLSIRFKQFCP
jgi:hypothetical protein